MSSSNNSQSENNTDDALSISEQLIEATKEGNIAFLQKHLHSCPSSSYKKEGGNTNESILQTTQCSSGCSLIHWAAGSNQISTVKFLLGDHKGKNKIQINNNEGGTADEEQKKDATKNEKEEEELILFPDVNIAITNRRAKGRTPLHYACRNGHLEMVQLLTQHYNAKPNIRAKQGVTPLQLSIWQNHLHVSQYLVNSFQEVICSQDVNDFGCNLVHWLGIVPYSRANINLHNHYHHSSNRRNKEEEEEEGGEGDDLIPMVEWLSKQPNMKEQFYKRQNQNHSILHKAAWGGHLSLLKYVHNVFGLLDDTPDHAGNYAADLSDMANTKRHAKCAKYLREECNGKVIKSYKILGLIPDDQEDNDDDNGICVVRGKEIISFTMEEIRKAYLCKAKELHPDRKQQQYCQSEENSLQKYNDNHVDFDSLQKAYEHLTLKNGVGDQRNPAHSINLLLEMQQEHQTTTTTTTTTSGTTLTNNENSSSSSLFKARLLAVLLEYGDKGIDLCNIPKKWNQVWPDVPFFSLSEDNDGKEKEEGDDTDEKRPRRKKKRKKGELLRYIEKHSGDVVDIIRPKHLSRGDGSTSTTSVKVIPKNITRKDVEERMQKAS